jgi:hypothetical protein
MSAVSIARHVTQRIPAVIATALLFGCVAYLTSAFVWLLKHVPAAGVIEAIFFTARSLGETYPGTLMTPAFLGAGLGVVVAGLWRGAPPLASALVPWLVIALAIAGAGLYSTETTLAGLFRAWPLYLCDGVIASLCWAVARAFW